jgi:hypothetical protein
VDDDDIVIPPHVLDFFRQLRELADKAVSQMEAAAATGGGAVFAYAGVATAVGTAVDATVVTAERVAEASVFVGLLQAASAAAKPAWLTAEVLAVLEGLLQLAERLLGIGD